MCCSNRNSASTIGNRSARGRSAKLNRDELTLIACWEGCIGGATARRSRPAVHFASSLGFNSAIARVKIFASSRARANTRAP